MHFITKTVGSHLKSNFESIGTMLGVPLLFKISRNFVGLSTSKRRANLYFSKKKLFSTRRNFAPEVKLFFVCQLLDKKNSEKLRSERKILPSEKRPIRIVFLKKVQLNVY